MGFAKVLWGRPPQLPDLSAARRVRAAQQPAIEPADIPQVDAYHRAHPRQTPAPLPEAKLGALELSFYQAQALSVPRPKRAHGTDEQQAIFLYEVLTRTPNNQQLATALSVTCALIELLMLRGWRLTPQARGRVETALMRALGRMDFEAMVKAVPGWMVARLCDPSQPSFACYEHFVQSLGVRQAINTHGPAPRLWFKPLCALRDLIRGLPGSEPELRRLISKALHRVARAAGQAGDIGVIDHLRDVDFTPLLKKTGGWPRVTMLLRLGEVTSELSERGARWGRGRWAPIDFNSHMIA